MTITSYDLAGGEPQPLTIVELEALKDLCKDLPQEPIIVNIGAGIGCSTMAILEECQQATIFSIDKYNNDTEMVNLKNSNLQWQNVIQIVGASQDVGIGWPFWIDMVFIDGEHRQPYIDEDIKLFTRWLKPGRLAVFHDYILPENRAKHIKSQVYEAVQDWLEREPQFREVCHVERIAGFVNRGKNK